MSAHADGSSALPPVTIAQTYSCDAPDKTTRREPIEMGRSTLRTAAKAAASRRRLLRSMVELVLGTDEDDFIP